MKRGGDFIVSPVDKGWVFSREQFTEDHKMFVEAVQEFGRDRVSPVKEDLNKLNRDLSRQIFKEMGELGFLGIDFPEKYGGLSLDKVTTTIVAENLMSGGNASLLVTFSDHTGIATLPIIWYGSEAQKAKYLPKLANGDWMGSFALTESGAGSDVMSATVTARLNAEGTHYLLNGTKIFVTNGSWADTSVTFAKVDGKYTAFILDKNCDGWVIGPEEHKMGIKGSSTCTFFYEDCKVPVENRLGEVGQGTAIALNVLYTGRYKLGATTMGGSKYALNIALNYAFEREQFNRPIAEFAMIKRKFAKMIVRSWEADTICYITVGSIDKAMENIKPEDPEYYVILQKVIEDHGIEASLSKVVASEAMAYNIDEAVQIFGGAGYIEDYPVSVMYRDERINRIFEGTNEINRLIIGSTTLKKAILEEIPIREMIGQRETNWIPDLKFAPDYPLYKEAQVIEFSRSMLFYVLNRLILKYGQDLKNEQWALEPLANMLIALAVMDTGFKRYRLIPENDIRRSATEVIVKLSVMDHFENLFSAGIDLLQLVSADSGSRVHLDIVEAQKKLLNYTPERIACQQTIIDLLYRHKQYFLD